MDSSSEPTQPIADHGVVAKGSTPSTKKVAAALDTSELRWFAIGRPPRDMVAAFSAEGTKGTTERRSDIYQVNGRHDLGVKRRAGLIIEAKQRQAVGPTIGLVPGIEAPLEDWRKWNPSDGDELLPAPDVGWIKVNKAILTRTFILGEGEVVGPASHPDQRLSGCDVEIAAVTVGGIEAWTFALESFGPKDDRNSLISRSWQLLVVESNMLESLGAHLGRAAGYPEWLDLVVSGRVGSDRSPRLLAR